MRVAATGQDVHPETRDGDPHLGPPTSSEYLLFSSSMIASEAYARGSGAHPQTTASGWVMS
jgi:hypothetical protein